MVTGKKSCPLVHPLKYEFKQSATEELMPLAPVMAGHNSKPYGVIKEEYLKIALNVAETW